MTTIAETQGKAPDVIDAIASAATALTEWSDADPAIINDQSTENYTENGRVLEHGPSGIYVGLFLHSTEYGYEGDDYNSEYAGGIRVVHSTDWDTENNVPAGKTDTRSGDPWSGDVGNDVNASFTSVDMDSDDYNRDYGPADGSTQVYFIESNISMADLQTTDVTYFGSVTSDWINFAAWNTTDGNNGRAGYYSFEYVNDKFWPDGNDPFTVTAQSSVDYGNMTSIASWNTFYGHNRNNNSFPYDASGFDRPEWCVVNPASDDDTYFFRRGVMYQTSSESIPVAYMKAAIGNDVNEGGAHGDTIDHEGETYRVVRQSGAGTGTTLTAGLRYE